MNYDDPQLRRLLDREIPYLTAEIRGLYRQLDRKFHLRGAHIPITFGYDRDLLGSYTRPGQGEEEHFHFSLLFVGYALKNPLSKEDRNDLFLHEYAHYMQYNMAIPKEYTWQAGTHGSAWKYCCSLTGAAPTPFYKAGEGLQQHNYEDVMKKKSQAHYRSSNIRYEYHRDQEYKTAGRLVERFRIGETVLHPKFGRGVVEEVEVGAKNVILLVRFGEELRRIDQEWMYRNTRLQKNKDT